MVDWGKIREEFSSSKGCIYLNNAAVSIIPKRSFKAIPEVLSERCLTAEERMERREALILEVKELIAKLINASAKEITLTVNTSDAINIVAQGIELTPGDNVVIPATEFPANLVPWLSLKRKGVEVRLIQPKGWSISIEELISAVDKRTKVIAVSEVCWISGVRVDLERLGEFCEEQGILLVVDGVQAVGAIGVDVKRMKASAYAAGGYKWLLSPCGTGFLYLSEDLLGKIPPTYYGYEGMTIEKKSFSLKPKEGGDRYRTGSLNYLGIAMMGESLKMLLEIGKEQIEEQVLTLKKKIYSHLSKKGYDISPFSRSGIISLYSKKAERIYRRLQENRIVAAFKEGKFIRFSPHFYNTEEEIAFLLSLL